MKFPILSDGVRRFAPLAIVLLSVTVAICAYLQAVNFPFAVEDVDSDDSLYVVNNVKLAGLHLADLWRLFIEPYNPFEFLPLRDLSYWLDIAFFGMSPPAFRLHSIALYLICCLLVYLTTLELWRYFKVTETGDAKWAAATVAALFALHPAHVDAVIWISSRKDVLSSMFAMLALWLAIGARREHGLAPWHAGAALAALAAAILSKATMVFVAPVMAIFWIVLWHEIPASSRRRTMLLWPFASLLLTLLYGNNFHGIQCSENPCRLWD
ncbi:MAG: hypothetical protein HY306_12995 [Nitrosomonadales bacterium]|nr:hypothetical protein [Nitrosomonadales bacterium]